MLIDYDTSTRREKVTYLTAAGWKGDWVDYWTDPLDPSTRQPFDEALLIQMGRDGLPTPEREE